MELRFRVAIDVPNAEPGPTIVRKLFMLLASELLRAAANIDGPTKEDAAMHAAADVVGAIADNKKV